MTQERPSPPPPSRPGRPESWRTERMVQRVPAHLGETTREALSPWIVIGGAILLALIVCIAVQLVFRLPLPFVGAVAVTPTPTRAARTPTPIATNLPVTAPPASPTPTVPTVKYKVRSGDNLTVLANRYHVSIQAIMQANGLKDETIRIGDELIIPLPTPTSPPGSNPVGPPAFTPTPLSFQPPPTSAVLAGTPGVIRHIVTRGETLITIAASYGSTVNAIRVANQLDSDLLSIGQELLMPIGSWTPTATFAAVVNATATPTAQFAYPAPSLLWPPDNSVLRGTEDAPTLSWASPATLKANESYVVHVDYSWAGEKKSIVRQIKQGNSVKLELPDYLGASRTGTQFSWYVVIVSQVPGDKLQTFAQSPSSVTRSFTWY